MHFWLVVAQINQILFQYLFFSTLILIGCYKNLYIFDWLLHKSIKHYFNICFLVHWFWLDVKQIYAFWLVVSQIYTFWLAVVQSIKHYFNIYFYKMVDVKHDIDYFAQLLTLEIPVLFMLCDRILVWYSRVLFS